MTVKGPHACVSTLGLLGASCRQSSKRLGDSPSLSLRHLSVGVGGNVILPVLWVEGTEAPKHLHNSRDLLVVGAQTWHAAFL